MAETRGFEPPIRCYSYNGLANRRLQPLGHVSAMSGGGYHIRAPTGKRGMRQAALLPPLVLSAAPPPVVVSLALPEVADMPCHWLTTICI